MSCFLGKLKEFKAISLDRFDGDNLRSTMYFLSHCHADHMVGLDSHDMAHRLKIDSSIKLYCSSTTSALLLAISRFEHLRPHIEQLPIDEELSLPVPSCSSELPNQKFISVTLIPAGHCPGSVMFLLKADQEKVLYTGDFRYHIGDTIKLQSLFADGECLKSVYLDTTFCVPEALHIPSREECKQAIIDTIFNWFCRANDSPGRRIAHIFSRSSYGYEFLMTQLANFFNCKIHVSRTQFSKYRFLPCLAKILTTDAASTNIHFCQSQEISMVEENLEMCKKRANRTKLPCMEEFPGCKPDVLQIIRSVVYFTRSKVVPSEMFHCESETVIRMCYSSHSSYEEIQDFLVAIKPENIYPNVRPNSSLSLEDVRRNLMFLERPIRKRSSLHITSNELSSARFVFNKQRKIAFATANLATTGSETANLATTGSAEPNTAVPPVNILPDHGADIDADIESDVDSNATTLSPPPDAQFSTPFVDSDEDSNATTLSYDYSDSEERKISRSGATPDASPASSRIPPPPSIFFDEVTGSYDVELWTLIYENMPERARPR